MLGRGIRGAAALVGAGALLALAGCASTSAAAVDIAAPLGAGKTVVFGAHAPLTGPLGPQWKRITGATRAWFDYVNSRGGVNGRTLEYRVRDDRADPAVAKTAVAKLVTQDSVFAMLGSAGSATHGAVAGYLADKKVPDLFIGSGDRRWNDVETAPMRFGFAPDTTIEAKVLATTLDRQYNGQTEVNGRIVSTQYCAVVEKGVRGDEIMSGLRQVLGKNVVAEQRFSVTDTDLTAQVAALRAAGCQVNVVGGADVQTAAAITAARASGYEAKWATPSLGGGITTIADALPSSYGEYVNGLLTTTALPVSNDDPWVKLFAEVNAQFGDGRPVDSDVIYGMSVGYAATEAVSEAGDPLSRKSLAAALEDGRVNGNGLLPLAYSTLSHAPYQGVGVVVAQDGAQSILGRQVMLGSATGPKVVAYVGAPVPLAREGLPKG
ncbi:MAG: ABC transporter substrate-binding protein [Micrococcales bacterium]|nr:ABC transporter substrate-binding protein [Micrococcales bacterium]